MDDDVALDIRARFGSVEHYFHFLLGFVTPLVLKIAETQNSNRRFLIRSCSILDRIIHELKFDNLVIVDKRRLSRIISSGDIHSDTLYGYDLPAFYNRAIFGKLATYLNHQLFEEIRYERDLLERAFDQNQKSGSPTLKTSLIDRGPPHEFYNSAQAEVKTAGNQRRSVKNFDDLVSTLNSKGFNVLKFYLEERPLSFQMALFQNSDIVIAQHGASLSNLIWAHAKLSIVEIMPSTRIVKEHDFFGDLARCLGLKYFSVNQHGDHGTVSTSEILDVTNRIYNCQMIQWWPKAEQA